jgi:ribonuclease D
MKGKGPIRETGFFHKGKNTGMTMRINSFENAISFDQLKALPMKSFTGEILVIDKPESVPRAVEMLREYKMLGFDTETKPAFRKGVINEVALLQFAAKEKAFIFRLKNTGLPEILASLLASEKILKAGVAIRDDIKSLQKLRRFTPGGFIELQDMVKKYNITDSGLRKLSGIILGIQISKSQQVSNWEREVLTDAQLVYAATDAWVCHEIYRILVESG